MRSDDFAASREGLELSLDLLLSGVRFASPPLPSVLPEQGFGHAQTLRALAGPILDDGRDLGAPGFLAHMDPPTPWITWAMHLWTARMNQNLLHPDTAPRARELEERLIEWLAPLFAMSGGHMTPGSTIANLTALWCAREAGAREVVARAHAHLSVRKAAKLLGMPYRPVVSWDRTGNLAESAAVITAGATSTGEIEPLDAAADALWRHVDAAWAGSLRLSDRHGHLLNGVENADSVCISAHKWLFQPKESAFVLFAEHEPAHASISLDGEYLAVPNVGVLGSHGARAAPLLATLLAYGRVGVADAIDRTMQIADDLWALVDAHPRLEARSRPQAGVVCWRHRSVTASAIREHLPPHVLVSTTVVDGESWLRSVAANPMGDPALVVEGVLAAASEAQQT